MKPWQKPPAPPPPQHIHICVELGTLRVEHHQIEKPKPRGRAVFGFAIGLPQKKGENMPLELKITNEQKISVTVSPKTDTGKPASLDGSPAWTVISGNASVVVSDDGLSATLISADDPGDTQVMVKADADLGEGIEEISDIITLSVVGATAKNLGLAAGQPEAKETPA